MEPQGKSEVGTISGIIVVIVILLVGAVYFFNQGLDRQKQMESLNKQESIIASDDADSIASDTTAIDLSGLGEGVDQLK